MLVRAGFAAIALSLSVAGAAAQEVDADTRGTYSATYENDIFAGTDRGYSNGVLFQYISAADQVPDFLGPVQDNLTWLTGAQKWHWSVGLGQNMYTPQDLTVANPSTDDRPYAGFLYASIGLIADDNRPDVGILDVLQLDIGVTGPASYAEETQIFVHDLIDTTDPQGWDTQIENEVAFRLLYERVWKAGTDNDIPLTGLEYDITPHVGGSLGTAETYIGAGIGFRIGDDLEDDYGPPRVRPALGGPGFFEDKDGFSWYLFSGIAVRAVGRDMFVEGNLFEDSRGVDLEPFQADLQSGVAVQVFNTEFAFTYVVRSPQFQGQDNFSKFGSLNARFRF
ncbi:MAG: lipid A deacylase LpxR family protein [Alphaproteobacteria bacterium]